MRIIDNSLPLNDGFHMPAEFDRHTATIMIWPERPGSWGKDPEEARKTFVDIIRNIAHDEKVFLIASKKEYDNAVKQVGNMACVINIETNDAWARDTAPTFLIDSKGHRRAVNWKFNAWGGDYDGLYDDYEEDDALAACFCNVINCDMYDASPFVLEGGSIHCDGEGTVMTTETCLLSGGRNPDLTKSDIEKKLIEYLGAEKVLWLPCGIYNDETNEHVDNVCAFIRPGEVVLAWSDNHDDPQFEMSSRCLDYLNNVKDARGREITVHKLPVPEFPITVTEEECNGMEYADGEDVRTPGERLAGSYVNFYITNNSIILPRFGGKNTNSDQKAIQIMKKMFPERNIIPIQTSSILLGGGNIHCITQQIPEGENIEQHKE